MSTSPLTVLAYATVPVMAAIIGSIVAAVRTPGASLRSGVQHLAAGVVFAAVAGELLPEVLRIHRPAQVVVGFAAGVGLMLLVRHVTEPSADASASSGGDTRSLLVAVGIDLAIDGLLVGIGFAAGAKTGVLLVIALTLEVLFLGVSTASALGTSGVSTRRTIAICSGLASLLAIGAGVGSVLLHGISDSWLEVMLGFGAAALLYLVTEELLTEAHEVPETPFTTALFFVGFLVLLLVEMVA